MENKPEWLSTSLYPFKSGWMNLNGAKMHYVDEGAGEVLLFVHGTPSWSFDFRKVIMQLRSSYRCIAPDHIGFGLSDKPSEYAYSCVRHSLNLAALIRHLGLEKITLVLHDFGGPIGWKIAIDQPELVSRMVVLNSWMWDCTNEPGFQRFRKMLQNPIVSWLYRNFNFSASVLLPASFGRKKPTGGEKKHYSMPFRNRPERKGPLAFVDELVSAQSYFETLWVKREVLARKPFLFIWGMNDPLIQTAYLRKFLKAFPDACCVELPGCGHFPQDEEGDAVSGNIHRFMRTY